jgi:hypothetical protein
MVYSFLPTSTLADGAGVLAAAATVAGIDAAAGVVVALVAELPSFFGSFGLSLFSCTVANLL